MSEKLKPCPFCGSSNVDWFRSFGDPSTNENIVNVQCINCGAQGASKLGEKNAIDVWNKRAGSGAINSEMLTIISNMAECDSYPHYKELKDTARKLIQRIQK